MPTQADYETDGILPIIYQQLRSTLIDCGPFSSHDELKAVFVDNRIHPWRKWIPEAKSASSRVEAVIDFLYNQYTSTQDNALVLLLHVLSERKETGDACHQKLFKLADDLSKGLESHLSPDGTPLTPPPDMLPRKSYDHFTGRAKELQQLLDALRNPDQYQLIAIYGLGGIGKTALAREALEDCRDEKLFQHIVWMSAKTERFEGEGTHRLPVSSFSLDDILNEIARQCHLPHLAKLPSTEKVANIQHILANRPVLIVLDNMETVKDCKEVVGQLVELLTGQTKFLLTSKLHITNISAFEMRLLGLSPENGELFMRREGRSQGASEVADAPSDILQNIVGVCGGAPLAMKLIVSQLKRRALQDVLDNLKVVTSDGPDYDFYRFIYKGSWDLLSLDAKKVLVSMSVFDLESGGRADMMREVSDVAPDAFEDAVVELVMMSLTNLVGQLGQRRYTLHQLTYYFILSDIVKKWG
ncbi:MAG: ATP-binding protein [Anaerolineae bacterium]|nr:ATP-binding protein [Anaerolineae bacterium]